MFIGNNEAFKLGEKVFSFICDFDCFEFENFRIEIEKDIFASVLEVFGFWGCEFCYVEVSEMNIKLWNSFTVFSAALNRPKFEVLNW